MADTPQNGAPVPVGMVQVEIVDMATRQVHLPYMHPQLGQQVLNVSFDQMFGVLGLLCQKLMAEEQARAKGGAVAPAPATAPPSILRAGAAPALTPAQLAEIARKAREDRR